MPISVVLADDDVMEVMEPGTHGSTFGGNPLAAAVGLEAIQIIKDEKLVENSYTMGEYFRNTINKFNTTLNITCRGKGLLNAIEFENKDITVKVSIELQKRGLLAKSTRDNVLRLSPPLIIHKTQMDQALDILHDTFTTL